MYKSQFVSLDDKPCDTRCPLCDCTFVLPTNETDFLTHLFQAHRLVIADVWKIANLRRYDGPILIQLPITFVHLDWQLDIISLIFQLCTLLEREI